MGNRTITYTLLGVVILIYTAYFITLGIVSPSGQPIISELNNVIEYAQKDKWTEAEESANKLMQAWDKVKYLLAFNYAEEDYSLFLENLVRIQGGIKTKNITETVTQALAMQRLWENYLKVIPQP